MVQSEAAVEATSSSESIAPAAERDVELPLGTVYFGWARKAAISAWERMVITPIWLER